jgi:hypothetical protein
LCPHVSIDSNSVGVWIPMVNGAWIPPIHHPNDYMPKFESRWRGWHVTTNFLPYASNQYNWCHFLEWYRFSSWGPPCWPMPTKLPWVCHIFISPCAPSSIRSKCGS